MGREEQEEIVKDRQYIGLFLMALGLALPLSPLWDDGDLGRQVTAYINDRTGWGQIFSALAHISASIAVVVLGAKVFFTRSRT